MIAPSCASPMMGTLATELKLFCGCVGAGFAAGALYDALRFLRLAFRVALRNNQRVSVAVDFALDTLYYAAVTVLFFSTLLALNGGELRLYQLAGLFGALAIYAFTVSKSTARATAKLERAIRVRNESKESLN